MFASKKLFVPLVVAATAGPYLAMDQGWRPTWLGGSPSQAKPSPMALGPEAFNAAPAGQEIEHSADQAGQLLASSPIGPSGGTLIADDFARVLRFDVTPAQVAATFPRVTTVLADTELEGLRVPLVTGTRAHDVAGSLTYYFDRQHRLQRLTFTGTTGDPRALIDFAAEKFKLTAQPTLDAALYTAKWNGRPTSALRVVRSAVVDQARPLEHYRVQLEVNRAFVPYRYHLTPEFERNLAGAKATSRW